MIQHRDTPPVFMPDNEPYLGLGSLFWFDKLICWSMESNVKAAEWTRQNVSSLTAIQHASCQIIPQGIGIALSIRELLRQAYLFSAMILIRPLIERAAVISYLTSQPEAVVLWEDGWRHKKRPSLATMLATMVEEATVEDAQKICSAHNHMVHGDPMSCYHNLISLPDGTSAYASGKMLNSPDMCDHVAMEAQSYLIVLSSHISMNFPDIDIQEPPEKK